MDRELQEMVALRKLRAVVDGVAQAMDRREYPKAGAFFAPDAKVFVPIDPERPLVSNSREEFTESLKGLEQFESTTHFLSAF